MTIERTKDEVIIRLSSNIKTEDLQDMINYVRYKELTSDFEVKQAEVDALAKEVNQGWWAYNHSRFIK